MPLLPFKFNGMCCIGASRTVWLKIRGADSHRADTGLTKRAGATGFGPTTGNGFDARDQHQLTKVGDLLRSTTREGNSRR